MDRKDINGDGADAGDYFVGLDGIGSRVVRPTRSGPVDLPLYLVERLLASRIVPREAKLAAIQAWRRELAESRFLVPEHRAMDMRLSEAYRFLAAQPRSSQASQFTAQPRQGRPTTLSTGL